MLDFIKSDVSIKNLAHSTVDQLASYSLDQLKGIIAKALTDDWNKTLAAKEVKKIFSDNELFVSSEKATSKLFWCEMSYLLAQYYFWNKPIKQLDKDGNEVVEGVYADLSSVCGESTVATVNQEIEIDDNFSLWDELTSDVAASPEFITTTETVIKKAVNTVSELTFIPLTKINLFSFLIKLDLIGLTNFITFSYQATTTVSYLINLVKIYQKPPSNCYNWHYLDHIVSGSFKEITSTQELKDLVLLINTLNTVLEPVKQIQFSKSVLKIQMKPKNIITNDVNGRKLNRIEKQKQTNNDYANRRKTLMSTTESPGKNVNQSSVKESVLFKASKFLSEPFIRNGKANIDGILSISVNGHQVYPCSLISHLDENNLALDLLDDATKELVLSKSKIKVDELTPSQLAALKTYKRRKDIATDKVKQQSFQHTRGKIHNGFSPSFEAKGKKYCFEIDSNNRVRLWQLASNSVSTVSANDLIKGSLISDIGYLEVNPYTTKQWVNLTLDMIKGGSEARLESFKWIATQLNSQLLPNDECVYDYLSNLKTKQGKSLKIQNLKVVDNVVSGSLYGSQLLIAKRDVNKNKVVLHPTAKVLEQYLTIANIWVNSLPNNSYFKSSNKSNNLGLNNIDNKTRVVVTNKPNKTAKRLRNTKDVKYLVKMLTKFTVDGIYADKERLEYLGKLVKTDGNSLDVALIERIVKRVLDTFPLTQNISTLFTPTHYLNTNEFTQAFLKLLKLYGQVELAILINGKIQLITDSDDTVLINWCRSLYNYLKGNGKAVESLTINDAIKMLEQSSYSQQKSLLLQHIPTSATLNNNQLLGDVTGHNKTELKTFSVDASKLTKQYESLVHTVRFNNGLVD